MSLLAFRDALVAIYNADSAVQTVTGRTTLSLAPRGAQVEAGNLPIATYLIVDSPQFEGSSGHRDVLVQLEFWVLDTSATLYSDLETLADRAEALFTGVLLTAQGVDAARPRVVSRRDRPLVDGVRSILADMRFDLTN